MGKTRKFYPADSNQVFEWRFFLLVQISVGLTLAVFPQIPCLHPEYSFIRLTLVKLFAILIFISSFPPSIPQCFHTSLEAFPQFYPSFPQAVTVGSALAALRRFSSVLKSALTKTEFL